MESSFFLKTLSGYHLFCNSFPIPFVGNLFSLTTEYWGLIQRILPEVLCSSPLTLFPHHLLLWLSSNYWWSAVPFNHLCQSVGFLPGFGPFLFLFMAPQRTFQVLEPVLTYFWNESYYLGVGGGAKLADIK